jgi:S1-C subfamily serine protease
MATYDDRPPYRSPQAGCWGPALLLAIVAAAAFFGWRYWQGGGGLNPNAQPRSVEARGELASFEKTNIEVYERISPSLVQVTNLTERGNWFGLNVQEVPKGVGSGFVWDQDGHIVTNYHVVAGADGARVTLADHSSYEAHDIWAYPDKDIAVVSITAPKSKLHPIPLGTSHDLKVGQVAYALGDPFGLDQTMTTGIVSALGREIESATGRPIQGVIQISAAINPGNSGGPLLDSSGRLIGMNTAILSPSGAFAGIGFAIPVDEINQVVPQLIQHGKVVRPRIGVQLVEDQLARRLGVDRGALVLKVVPNSPAAQAGLRGTGRDRDGQIHLGDVIIAIDGKPIKAAKDLYSTLDHHKVGDTVTLTIIRDGENQDVPVTLPEIETSK